MEYYRELSNDFKKWILPDNAFDFSNQAELEELRREEKRKADQESALMESIDNDIEFTEIASPVSQNLKLLYAYLDEQLGRENITSVSFPTAGRIRGFLNPVVNFLAGMGGDFGTHTSDKEGGEWSLKREMLITEGQTIRSETRITSSIAQNNPDEDFTYFSMNYIDIDVPGAGPKDETLSLTRLPKPGISGVTRLLFTFNSDDSYSLEYSVSFKDPTKLQIDPHGQVI